MPSCSSTSTSSSFNNGTNESNEDNIDENKELTNSCQKARKSLNPVPQLIDNKRKHLERLLSLAPRDQLLLEKSKLAALFRKDLTNAIRESNETFAKSLNQISLSNSTFVQSLAKSFEFMSQMMFNNNSQQRHYPSNLPTYQNNFSVQSHNQQGQPLYNNIDSSFSEFGYVCGRNTSVNHENHESGTTYQQL